MNSNRELWRGAMLPALAVTVIASVIAWFVEGGSGLLGALLSSFTVAIFFSVSLLIAHFTKDANPMMTMALAMFSYFTKLLLMTVFLLAVTRLTEPDQVNRQAFGLSAIAIAFAWLAGEVRAFLRLRLTLSLPHKEEVEKDEQS
jgi:ATP synthase protein I